MYFVHWDKRTYTLKQEDQVPVAGDIGGGDFRYLPRTGDELPKCPC